MQILSDPTLIFGKYLNVNCSSCDGKTPLHYASLQGDEEMVRAIINLNPDFDKAANDGNLAIHLAAERRNYGIVRLLGERCGRHTLIRPNSVGKNALEVLVEAWSSLSKKGRKVDKLEYASCKNLLSLKMGK